MAQRQMKEREESLLSMLGYVKFIHESEEKDSKNHYYSTQNYFNPSKTSTNLHQQVRLKQKKQLSEKFLKISPSNQKMSYDTAKTKDMSDQQQYLKQHFQSYLQTPKNEFTMDDQFKKEFPLINKSDGKIQNHLLTPKQTNPDLYYHSARYTHNSKVQAEDQQNSQNMSNSSQIIQEIFINQQLKQRIPTPQLTQQVNKFFKSRKFLLNQLNSFNQPNAKLNNFAISDLSQKIPTETNRSNKSVFKDFKLNVQEISNSLSRAKMLSAKQLSENRFSLSSYTATNLQKRHKAALLVQNEVNGQQGASHLLKPLNFKQYTNTQANKSKVKTLEGIRENQEFQMDGNFESINEIKQKPYKNNQTKNDQAIVLNTSNEYQTADQNKQNSNSKPEIKSNNLETNRWVLKNPLQQPQLGESSNQNDNKNNNNNQGVLTYSKSFSHQFNIGQFIQNKINNKQENQQSGTQINQIMQNGDTFQDERVRLDKQKKQKSKTMIHKFDFQKQDQSNKNSQTVSSKNIKSQKNIQLFEGNSSRSQNLKKYETSQLIQFGESSSFKDKKAKPYLDTLANNNTYEFLEQFQQYQQLKSIQQNTNETQIGGQGSIRGVKIAGIQTQFSLQQPALQKKRNSQIKSPSSSTSPIKRKLFQQQIHEDNYIIMNSALIQELNQNEVLSQYIQQCGYSIEMFSFYMIKLYYFCTNSSHHKKETQNNEHNENKQTNFTENVSQQSNRNQYVQEFPTLKVNEQTFLSVLEIFVNKMKELSIPSNLIKEFQEQFLNTIKNFMPQTLIDDLGGLEKIKLVIQKLLEHLCYEDGIIPAFDGQLIHQVCEGVIGLLRSDQSTIDVYLSKLKNSPIQISNAEIYHIKIGIGKVMQEMFYPKNQISQIVMRINKQRGFFNSLNNFSKDSSFRNAFIQSISKNKKIIGYFLDPSQNIIQNFYDEFFQTIFGQNRFVDLIDYFEHKLKTNQIPLIMIEEIHKTIIEAYKLTQQDANSLAIKDIAIKVERIKQKADLITYQFINVGMEISELVDQLIEWCEYALININLPDGMQEDSIIKPEFLKEYFFLVLSEDDQLFSIYDLDYSVTYHNIIDFDYCFNMWLSGIQEVLHKNLAYPKENIKDLISYLRMNSLLINS